MARTIQRLAAATAAVLMLLAPALWNGFPLLQYDTGGYLARWHEGTLEESRSTVYGLFLNLLVWPDFWPTVIVQAVLSVWIIGLVLRVHGLGERPRVLLVTVGALSVLTTLPWLASQLLTDIFASLAVLALYLMVLCRQELGPGEYTALFLFLAFAAATHSATMLVLAALIAAGFCVGLFARSRVPLANLARGLGALALGAAMLVAANYAVAGRLAWTPGGAAILFGRMLQVGIVDRYLGDHCPDPRLTLCSHRAELPQDADVFFWGESIFDRLGRFAALNDEMRTIALESLVRYPWAQLQAALIGTAEQLVAVRTGYGVHDEVWHSQGMIEQFAPSARSAMQSARQQKGELGFTAINWVHVPVALASMLLLPFIFVLGMRRKQFADPAVLAAVTALSLLANAFVCGALSNPHDRYGARMVWLAPLVIALAALRMRDSAARAG
jgi:hypothetical protein